MRRARCDAPDRAVRVELHDRTARPRDPRARPRLAKVRGDVRGARDELSWGARRWLGVVHQADLRIE